MWSKRIDRLGEAFSSQAKFSVLGALAFLEEGLGLRELERSTQLSIRSVQVATEALVRQRLLRRTREGRFILNGRSPVARQVRSAFRFLYDEETRENARALSERAKSIVQLSDEVGSLVRKAKRDARR